MTKTITTKSQQRRKFLLILPALVVPALCIAFYALGGGRLRGEPGQWRPVVSGFNTMLPAPVFDKKVETMNKMDYYNKAEQDSMRMNLLRAQDPNYRGVKGAGVAVKDWQQPDTQANALLKRLDLLGKKMTDQGAIRRKDTRMVMPMLKDIKSPVEMKNDVDMSKQAVAGPDGAMKPTMTSVEPDSELDRLNEMLDKIARLQHGPQPDPVDPPHDSTQANKSVAAIAPAMVVPAMVVNEQQLISGATLALRLTAGATYQGVTLPAGQMVYGVVSLNNDRLQVSVRSVRWGQTILSTDWQVYDMDGLAGIHIPDAMSRQAAKQSAEQSIGGLNLSTYDPSIGGQVTNAGIQAARSFFSRKVRAVRVTVPEGYRVLLKDSKAPGSGLKVLRDTVAATEAPPEDSLESFLHEKVSDGQITLMLRGMYWYRNRLWMLMAVRNERTTAFTPENIRCEVQPRKRLKRMAVQELSLDLQYDQPPKSVLPGSAQNILISMEPFIPDKDRRVVLGMNVGYGQCVSLYVPNKYWKKIKTII